MAGCAVAAAILVAAVFAAVSLLVSAPVAIEGIEGGAVQLRGGWTWFFEFSHDRGATATLWSAFEVSVAEANRWSGVLLGAGLAALLGLAARGAHRGQDVLLPAAGAALLWLFATGKVYSVPVQPLDTSRARAGRPAPESDDRRRSDRRAPVCDSLGRRTALARRSVAGDPLSVVLQGGTAVLAVWVMTRIT